MVEVKVKQGWLSGEQLDTVTGDGQYYSFKGIPYAEPPLGKLRFKAPRPPLPWDGVRNATEHGAKCPQMNIINQQIELGNEDCLFLNVYTPDLKPASPLPVMVFIHGGGYKSGSGNDDFYGPDFLVTHGVILVTINYRLEVLGFLCLDTEDVPGNAGMKDQVAALRWVKENITNFGGDPDNVTVFGESAGGASAVMHVLSPMSKGLFKKAISMSGVPTCDWSMAFAPQKRAFMLAKDLGLDSDDPNEVFEFLQNVPVEKLLDTNPDVLSFEKNGKNNIIKMYHFTPVVEKDLGQEHFLTEDPLETLKNGKISDVDVFIGHTDAETLFGTPMFENFFSDYNRYPDFLVPRKIQINSTPNKVLEFSKRIHEYYFKGKSINKDTMKEFVTYSNHVSFVYDIYHFIANIPKVGNGRRYVYRFSCVSDRNVFGNVASKYGLRGASHLDDLMYLFDGKQHNLKIEKDTKEYKLIQLVCTVFTNFAKYGNPTPDSSLGVTCPEYDKTTKPYIDIGDTLTLGNDLDPEAMEFWRSIYADAGLDY